MATTPLPLVSISLEQLHANNLICGRAASFTSKIQDQAIIGTLQAPPTTSYVMDCHLKCSIDGLETIVQLNHSIFDHIKIGKTDMKEIIKTLPDPILMGSLNLIFKHILDHLKTLLEKPITLINLEWTTKPITPALSIVLEINNQKHMGLLGITPQHTSLLESIPYNQNPALDHIPIPMALEVGRTRLSTKKVSQLDIHDIIFFEKNWQQEDTHFLAKISEKTAFLTTLSNTTITVVQKVSLDMTDDLDDFDDDDDFDMDHDHELNQIDSSDTNNTTSDMNQIPIQLTFNVGEQSIPLGDIKQLAPGFTFQLHKDINNPVTIQANGKALAEGELINVNGQLGVRIIKMQ
ncbi:MAG: type III secretion system cytoplasmic ring protein SctQ [Endozoicomonadaceae bacterium]|nr:type III secretion system cytoplasmic ring protein SctQ [Endozoicomonadaceae bacterium]